MVAPFVSCMLCGPYQPVVAHRAARYRQWNNSFREDSTLTIHVTCHECGEEFALKDTAAGKSFSCKVCGVDLRVPGGSDDDDLLDEEVATRPRRPSKGRGSGNREAAAGRTFLPAIFLYIVAGLSVLNHAASIGMAAMGHNLNPFMNPDANPNLNPQARQAQKVGIMVGGIIGGVFGLIMDTLVIAGAWSMQSLRRYGLAMTGAIVALVPCLSPCLILGMPFGIWALVVLASSDVKQAFR